jgi:hypothetical protein
MSVMQLGVGLFYLFPAWLTFRAPPKLSADNIKTLIPIAMMHALGTIL